MRLLLTVLLSVSPAMWSAAVEAPDWSQVPQWAQSQIEVLSIESAFGGVGVDGAGQMLADAMHETGVTALPTPDPYTWIWFRLEEAMTDLAYAKRPDGAEYLADIIRDYQAAEERRKRIQNRGR